MRKLHLAAMLGVCVAPGLALGQPGASRSLEAPQASAEDSAERARLERQLRWAKIGTVAALGILGAGGYSAYRVSTMCDDYPDPADDCGVVKGVKTVGTLLILGVGAATTIAGVVGWHKTVRALEELDTPVRPTLRPVRGGALAGVSMTF